MKTIILTIVTIVIAISNIHAEDESNTHIMFQKGAIYSCVAISKVNVQDPGNILKYKKMSPKETKSLSLLLEATDKNTLTMANGKKYKFTKSEKEEDIYISARGKDSKFLSLIRVRLGSTTQNNQSLIPMHIDIFDDNITQLILSVRYLCGNTKLSELGDTPME